MRAYPGKALGNRNQFLGSPRGNSARFANASYQPSEVYQDRSKPPRTLINPDGLQVTDPVALTTTNAPALPFVIALNQHGKPIEAAGEGNILTLLIPPKNFSISSSHVNNVEHTRNGPLPTLWGVTQPVISMQGVSAAFMTASEGLTSAAGYGTESGVNRLNSIGYRNFLSLVAMFKSNGYKRLNSYEDTLQGKAFPGQTSRVVHVLDCVQIYYDGTTYFGHFTDLSFTADVQSPYHFQYSLSYTVTGVKGDLVRGHIGDGANDGSGIIIGNSASVVAPNMKLSKEAMQIKKMEYAQEVGSAEEAGSSESPGKDDAPSSNGSGNESQSFLPFFSKRASSPSALASYDSMPIGWRKRFDSFLKDLALQGYDIILVSAIRTLAPGEKDSKHNYGGAIDINLVDKSTGRQYYNSYNNGSKTYTASKQAANIARWRATGCSVLASRYRLKWGGNFRNRGYGDVVHFEVEESIDSMRKAGALLPSGESAEGD